MEVGGRWVGDREEEIRQHTKGASESWRVITGSL